MGTRPDAGAVPRCHYCGSLLDFRQDYSCVSCSMQTCDNCCEACQEEDCDSIVCIICFERHTETHGMESVAHWFTLPVHSATVPQNEGYANLRTASLGNLLPTRTYSAMYEDTIAKEMAQEGLRNIEAAIIRLLDAHPAGLRNVEIADSLGLRSEAGGGQRNWFTFSLLGGLVSRGVVESEGSRRNRVYFTRQA